MYWLEQLKKFKSESKVTYKTISEKSGIPLTTIEKLFSGRTKDPKLTTVDKIAACFGYSAADLIESKDMLTHDESILINNYRKLDMIGRSRVDKLTASEVERVRAESEKKYPVLYFDFPVSAGTGEFLDYETARIIELDSEVPKATSFVLRVAGDSMEPRFYDGDLVCVHSTKELDYGDIGIFSIQGNVYIKEYSPNGLVSLNPKYDIIKGSDQIIPLGRVLCRIGG